MEIKQNKTIILEGEYTKEDLLQKIKELKENNKYQIKFNEKNELLLLKNNKVLKCDKKKDQLNAVRDIIITVAQASKKWEPNPQYKKHHFYHFINVDFKYKTVSQHASVLSDFDQGFGVMLTDLFSVQEFDLLTKAINLCLGWKNKNEKN